MKYFLTISLTIYALSLTGCQTTSFQLAHTPQTDRKVASSYQEIREIQELPLGAQLPLDALQKYDLDTIGENIVARIERLRDSQSESTEAPYYDFRNDTTLTIVFHSRNIESIQKRGFLNRHQIIDALHNGLKEPEYDMAGLKLGIKNEKASYSLHPKYSYLRMDRNHPDIWATKVDPSYGNVVAILKDEVKDRTTFSAGNSFLIRDGVHALSYKTDQIFPEPNYARTHHQEFPWGHHWEAQIWGTLTFSMVDAFLVNCPKLDSTPEESLAILEKTGIPIYTCVEIPNGSRLYPGELIFGKSVPHLRMKPIDSGEGQ